MKKTISEIISIVMFTAILAFVVTSCQKDQNEGKSYEGNSKVNTSVSDMLAVLPFPICAPIPDILKNQKETNPYCRRSLEAFKLTRLCVVQQTRMFFVGEYCAISNLVRQT